jgi:hypothetical protein
MRAATLLLMALLADQTPQLPGAFGIDDVVIAFVQRWTDLPALEADDAVEGLVPLARRRRRARGR